MIWSTECSRVRQRIPLLPGGDLSSAEQAGVERHLLQCPECRQELARAEASQAVLNEVRFHQLHWSRVAKDDSLWSAIERQLAMTTRPADSRPGWIPVGALAAACAALLFIGLVGPGFDSTAGPNVGNDDSSSSLRNRVNTVGYGLRPARSLPYSDTESY